MYLVSSCNVGEGLVEINEDPLKWEQKLFIQRLLYSKGSQLPSLEFGRDSKTSEEWESFIVKKTKQKI